MPITLLEASDNFFAYEPVLKALQASSEATLPMQDLLQIDSSGQVRGLVSLSPIAHDSRALSTMPPSTARAMKDADIDQQAGQV